MNRIQTWLFAVLIFLWPSNLFFKFAEENGYVHGLLVDYLLPKIHVSDLLIASLLLCWVIELIHQFRHHQLQWSQKHILFCGLNLVALAALTVMQLQSSHVASSLWFLVKVVEFELLALWLIQHRQFFNKKIISFALAVMIAFQSLVGITQFTIQSSVFPEYAWLGETRLDKRAGLARGVFQYQEKILPYGTTSHPNVLAGVLAMSLILLWKTGRRHHHSAVIRAVGGIVSSAAIIVILLSQSWSAAMALVIGTSLLYVPRLWRSSHRLSLAAAALSALIILFSPFVTAQLAQHFTGEPSLVRRSALNEGAVNMFLHHQFWGVGLNAFVAHVETYAESGEVIRFVQPVHHVGLLMLSELGVVGMTLLVLMALTGVWLIGAERRQRVLQVIPYAVLPLVPLLIWDHYLWTQQVGQLLAVIGFLWLTYLAATERE